MCGFIKVPADLSSTEVRGVVCDKPTYAPTQRMSDVIRPIDLFSQLA
ncbi:MULTISPECIES: hypothetical protein [unclassified Rhizobium]